MKKKQRNFVAKELGERKFQQKIIPNKKREHTTDIQSVELEEGYDHWADSMYD